MVLDMCIHLCLECAYEYYSIFGIIILKGKYEYIQRIKYCYIMDAPILEYCIKKTAIQKYNINPLEPKGLDF